MQKLWLQTLVVLRASPTYLAVATLLLTAFASEIVPLIDGPAGVTVASWVATALVWVAAIVRVISRVTPVPSEERGLLPRRRFGQSQS